jgi:hypothetical protein
MAVLTEYVDGHMLQLKVRRFYRVARVILIATAPPRSESWHSPHSSNGATQQIMKTSNISNTEL